MGGPLPTCMSTETDFASLATKANRSGQIAGSRNRRLACWSDMREHDMPLQTDCKALVQTLDHARTNKSHLVYSLGDEMYIVTLMLQITGRAVAVTVCRPLGPTVLHNVCTFLYLRVTWVRGEHGSLCEHNSSNFVRNVTTAEAAAKHHICIHGSLHLSGQGGCLPAPATFGSSPFRCCWSGCCRLSPSA